MPHYLGLDLGGTNTKSAVVDERGSILTQSSITTPRTQGPEAVIQCMIELAQTVVTQARLTMANVTAVGVGSPGPIDLDQGVVVGAPNFTGFHNVPIRQRIAQALGRPTVMENDANAAAFAEYWVGAGRDPAIRNLVALTLGTGIGGGLVVDGQIVHGGFGQGGEVGHMIVVPDGRLCGCGQHGCLEAYASASSTAKRAQEAIDQGTPTTLSQIRLTPERRVTARDVFEAASSGDALASHIVDETAAYLGIACVNLCRLLDPQMILLAGGMTRSGDFLFDRVRHYFATHNWTISTARVQIAPAQLGSDAGVIGAAAVAWHYHPPGPPA